MKKILVIEDEKPLRDIYALILEKEGFEVNKAKNGEDGIKKLKTFRPDLIILDMLMPVLDGLGFLKSANLITDFPETKTIVVSNLSDAINDDQRLEYGVVDTFLKVNLSPNQLAEAARKYC
jgi:CheY-like chemotaxis protein